MILNKLTSTVTANGARSHSSVSRAVSLLLLVLIVYGTTVEAAHRHGNITPAIRVSATTFGDSGTAKTPGPNLTGCGDCLICQLHQNFSATAIIIRSADAQRSLQPQYVETVPLAVDSRSSTPQGGRAPPVSN